LSEFSPRPLSKSRDDKIENNFRDTSADFVEAGVRVNEGSPIEQRRKVVGKKLWNAAEV
jgi:hypothetical protein